MMPAMVCMDGFILSHTVAMTDDPRPGAGGRFLPLTAIPHRLADVPHTLGQIEVPHQTEVHRQQHHAAMLGVPAGLWRRSRTPSKRSSAGGLADAVVAVPRGRRRDADRLDGHHRRDRRARGGYAARSGASRGRAPGAPVPPAAGCGDPRARSPARSASPSSTAISAWASAASCGARSGRSPTRERWCRTTWPGWAAATCAPSTSWACWRICCRARSQGRRRADGGGVMDEPMLGGMAQTALDRGRAAAAAGATPTAAAAACRSLLQMLRHAAADRRVQLVIPASCAAVVRRGLSAQPPSARQR